MAITKPKTPVVRHAKKFHRVGGVRVSALEANRAAFFERVANTKPTEKFLREADAMVQELRAAQDAAFLAKFRRAVAA